MNNPRIARLIDLVPFVTTHQGIALKDLAEKFSVSVAEIEKDLSLLYDCGLPGHTPYENMEFTFDDGFVSVRNADELRHPRSLTQNEIAALVIGLEIIAANGDEVAISLQERLKKLLTGHVAYKPSPSDLYYREITEALQTNETLQIRYLGLEREIIPFEIYKEGNEVYLRSFCKRAGDRRTFKLSKIESLTLTGKKDLAPNNVPSENLPQIVSIKVHNDARRAQETFKSTEQVQFFSEDWLIGEVMAQGGGVELLSQRVRSTLREKVLAGQRLYL